MVPSQNQNLCWLIWRVAHRSKSNNALPSGLSIFLWRKLKEFLNATLGLLYSSSAHKSMTTTNWDLVHLNSQWTLNWKASWFYWAKLDTVLLDPHQCSLSFVLGLLIWSTQPRNLWGIIPKGWQKKRHLFWIWTCILNGLSFNKWK